MSRSLLEWAKYYLSKGFSVIPIKRKDKKPAIPTWKEYQYRLPTNKELQEWFGNGEQKNIAIVTGALSGIVAVDLDSDRAVEFAKANNFPESPLSKTAKGYHIIYRYKDGVRNFQKRDDLPDIDLRGEGGIIVVEPSIHPSGVPYQWVKGKGLDDIPIAEIPEIILAKIPQDKTALAELYRGVDKGNRNDSLTRLVGSWVNDGLTFGECLEFAYFWNKKNNPPLPEKEIERTVKSISEKHYQSKSPDTYSSGLIDPLTFLKKGSELLNLECSVEWLVDRLIPKQSIILLHGKGGIGKTWLSLILANAISKGIPFMDLETRQMQVVFVFNHSDSLLKDLADYNAGALVEAPRLTRATKREVSPLNIITQGATFNLIVGDAIYEKEHNSIWKKIKRCFEIIERLILILGAIIWLLNLLNLIS